MSERIPMKVTEHQRDAEGRRQNLVRSLHKRVIKANGQMSVKAMAKAIIAGSPIGVNVTPADVASAKAWLRNKKVNTSNPPQRIGRTNRTNKKK